MTANDSAPAAGTHIGPYVIVDALAKGGMATVFKARHKTLQREVALKLIRNDTGDDDDQQLTERLRREAAAVAAIRHPHVVEIYDANVSQEPFYIAMELLTGGNLQTRLRAYAATGKKMSFDEALRITREMASALDYAHSRKFVHRDIKPSNVMFASDGRAVLTDFGIVALKEGITRLTKTQNAIGTPAYMSPEQAKGIAVDGRSDLYSLGIMLYEMLAGTTPFEGGDTPWAMLLKHINEPPPPIVKHRPDTPLPVQAILTTALNKQPDARFQTAAQMIAAIDAVALLPSRAPTSTQPSQASTSRSLVRALGLVTAAAVLATSCFGAGYGAALLTRPAPEPAAAIDSAALQDAVRATVAALGESRDAAATIPTRSEENAAATPSLPAGPLNPPTDVGAALAGPVAGKLIIDGESLDIDLPKAGDSVRVTFDAEAGDRIDVFGDSTRTAPTYRITLLGPNGADIDDEIVSTGDKDAFHPAPLPVSGRYSLKIETTESGSGRAKLAVMRALKLGAIRIDDDPVNVEFTRPKQTAVATFDAAVGDELGMGVQTPDGTASGTITIFGPDGESHSTQVLATGEGFSIDIIRVTGTYTLIMSLDSDELIQPALSLSRPVVKPIALDQTQSLVIDRPGQVAEYTFDGTAGQTLRLTANNRGSEHMVSFSVLDADRNELGDVTIVPGQSGTIDIGPLPANGTYTILAAPFARRTGDFTLTLRTR
jgi:tRNA A-37 threonylcarbamoyl transferase component Bud32